jgi:hypothetical protein
LKNGNTAPGPNTTELADDAYRLAGIFPTAAPGDNVGRDWLTYRIAQGTNMITGYRRGDLRSVTAEIERIVSGLNERRIVKRGRVDLKPKAAASPASAPHALVAPLDDVAHAPDSFESSNNAGS